MELLLFVLVGVIFAFIIGLKSGAKIYARRKIVFNQSWVKVTDARIDRQIVAEMQFGLWWQNKGQSIVDNHIVNNGIALVEAGRVRDVAKIHAAHYAVNQLSIAAIEAQFTLVQTMMVSKQYKRRLETTMAEHNQSIIEDETILAELGYDIYKLRFTFLQ